MNIIEILRHDRRLQVLILTAVLAVVLGFVAFTPDQALGLMTSGGYWTILGTTAWFLWTLRPLLLESRPWTLPKGGDGWAAPALVAGCGVLLLVHEAYGFKILMDEIMLLGTSMGMHFDKHPLVPVRGHDLQGAFQLIDGRLDKRPLFQPFLVSILHDLTGYRPENVFALNTGLTFGLLGLVYQAGRRMAGRAAGVLGVLLLTSLPLLAQNATGGGFELLNLVMIVGTLLLGMRFAEKRDAASQQALLLSGVLLAQTRYESILFLLPVGLLVLWVWWTERKPVLSWGTCLVPLLFLPVALHQKIFAARESSWELASQPGFDKPFALQYASDNFAHWLNFFFDNTGEHSNSLVISTLGFIALPFCLLWAVKTLGRLRQATPVQAVSAFFTLGFAAHTLLLLCYFWGRFDDPVIRRLSLPLNLWLVLAVVIVAGVLVEISRWKRLFLGLLALAAAGLLAYLLPTPPVRLFTLPFNLWLALVLMVVANVAIDSPRWNSLWLGLITLTGIGYFAYSLPTMARHDYSMDYYVGREMAWRREFMAAHPEKDYLVIDPEALGWITHLVSATPVQQALARKDLILFNFQNRTFSAFYVFQRLTVDAATGALSVQKDYDLGPDFQLEPYWERRFTPLTVSRISRLVAIKGGELTPPSPAAPSLEKMSAAEREKARQAFFEQLIKRLP
ncbi:MAG TPA: glycosyltransferase family 39 protein [Lacunisphaera sp.]|nr:glycosyltransferase family 39 protein [Lacunisphaera sp.]